MGALTWRLARERAAAAAAAAELALATGGGETMDVAGGGASAGMDAPIAVPPQTVPARPVRGGRAKPKGAS